MAKRLVIVGGVAAGASAAAKARRTSEDIEIVLLEAGPYISFANCGLPYYVGGEIAQRDHLFVVTAGLFAKRFSVDVRVSCRATAVDANRRVVAVKGPDGKAQELGYDRLILATGASAIVPPIPGLPRKNVFAARTVPDIDEITQFLSQAGPRVAEAVAARAADEGPLEALIIGGGYIGLETAEQLCRRELKVTLVEQADQLMLAVDPEMAEPLRGALAAEGCRVYLGDAVAEIAEEAGRSVAVTRGGQRIGFDIGILAVGVRPNVELARSAGVPLGDSGAIAVDGRQRTNVPGIYAAGDNCEAIHLVTGKPVNIPLAGPANKAGRVAGANAALDLIGAGGDDPRRLTMRGVLGTAVVRVGGQSVAVTGLTEKQARKEGLPHDVMYMAGTSHASYYPGAEPILLKLLFDPADGRLLGAQAVGKEGVDKRIDVLAVALTAGMSVRDLEDLDLCYAPPFGSAKDVVTEAGFAAANVLRDVMPSMTPQQLLQELAGPNPPAVIDVRSPREYEAGHLDGALNIPVEQMRDRLANVPASRPVAVHCGVGYRSYLAQRILINPGRSNVRNILGGYRLIKQVQAARR